MSFRPIQDNRQIVKTRIETLFDKFGNKSIRLLFPSTFSDGISLIHALAIQRIYHPARIS